MDFSNTIFSLFGLLLICVVLAPAIILIILFASFRRLNPNTQKLIQTVYKGFRQQKSNSKSASKPQKSLAKTQKTATTKNQAVEFEDAEFKEIVKS